MFVSREIVEAVSLHGDWTAVDNGETADSYFWDVLNSDRIFGIFESPSFFSFSRSSCVSGRTPITTTSFLIPLSEMISSFS